MSSNFLEDILEYKRGLLRQKKAFFDSLKEKVCSAPIVYDGAFKKKISQPGGINLIAEIKMASPSSGVIRKDSHVAEIAKIYQEHGAAAISVLTEDKYFSGKPAHVKEVRACVGLPVLAKDFFIDETQIFEAKFNGAGAVLLIAAVLKDKDLKGLLSLSREFGLDCLIEIHDEWELDRALKAGAEIIGVNNRNLRTLEVNMAASERLIPRIPQGRVIVAESGIQSSEAVRRVRDLGAHAVLIGEAFMRARDIGQKMEEVMHGR
jgi:indole-3-glycerol phosphate synthase